MKQSRGFTLIELGVVIFIIAIIAGLAVPALSNITRQQLRTRSGELAGAIRSMYGQAAVAGKSCRLVIDLDGGAYWPECAKGTVRLSRELERSQNGARVMTREEEQAAQLAEEQSRGRDLSDKDKVKAELAAKSEFHADSGGEIRKVSLGKLVKFEDVWIQHQAERYTSGKAYLYFWPSGLTEEAGIRLSQGDDVYSLIVSPLTGRVKVLGERAQAPGEK